jgi:hypothetical protein
MHVATKGDVAKFITDLQSKPFMLKETQWPISYINVFASILCAVLFEGKEELEQSDLNDALESKEPLTSEQTKLLEEAKSMIEFIEN